MSKSEAAALVAYPVKMGTFYESDVHYNADLNKANRLKFIEGYEQAEKDLALSWEDMRTIFSIVGRVSEKHLFDGTSDQEVYEEVLKEFKEAKK